MIVLKMDDLKKLKVPGQSKLHLNAMEVAIGLGKLFQTAVRDTKEVGGMVAVIEDMNDYNKEWSGSMTELLNALIEVATFGAIDTTAKMWPRDVHVLSRRLNKVKSNLETVGISYEHRHKGGYKSATFRHADPNWTLPKKKRLSKINAKKSDEMDDL